MTEQRPCAVARKTYKQRTLELETVKLALSHGYEHMPGNKFAVRHFGFVRFGVGSPVKSLAVEISWFKDTDYPSITVGNTHIYGNSADERSLERLKGFLGHEQPAAEMRGVRVMTTEFDEVFEQLEAPEYPATCDQCGEVGTNVSIEEHVCGAQVGEQWQADDKYIVFDKVRIGSFITAELVSTAVTEHNQHATLVEQHERLLRLLRPVTSPTACYCAVMKGEKCWHCEARELLTTIEQERAG